MHFVKELRSRLFPELQIVYTCFLFYFSRQCRQCCAARPTPSWTSSFWVVTPLSNCPTEKSSPHTSGSMEPARISAAKIELWTRFRRDPKVSLLPFVFIHHRNCAGEILNRLAWVVNLFIKYLSRSKSIFMFRLPPNKFTPCATTTTIPRKIIFSVLFRSPLLALATQHVTSLLMLFKVFFNAASMA